MKKIGATLVIGMLLVLSVGSVSALVTYGESDHYRYYNYPTYPYAGGCAGSMYCDPYFYRAGPYYQKYRDWWDSHWNNYNSQPHGYYTTYTLENPYGGLSGYKNPDGWGYSYSYSYPYGNSAGYSYFLY